MNERIEKGTRVRTKRNNTAKLRIIPLGGLGEIGKNMTAVEYKNDIIIVDCGLTFPDEEMLGVDVVIPDITYLEQNRDKVKAILLTHGHEDHYGAVPFVLKKLNVPVYCMRLTAGMLENKLKEHGLGNDMLQYVQPKEKISIGSNFKIEFIRVAHSIPDACAIAIHNPVGTVLFTGDFKFDYTPIDGEMTDIVRLSQLGQEGVMVLLADSTNVEHPGVTMSEKSVGETFDQIFSQAKDRIIVATFASNLHRVQQVITASENVGRKVVLIGRSMLNNVTVASNLGYLKVKANTLVDLNQIDSIPRDKVTLLITGTQGEPMSALTRISKDEHRRITLTEEDTVIISASQIPGNEKSIGDVINNLMAHGAKVIYSSLAEVHVSGHACQEELKLMHALTKPKYFIPAHGEARMLIQHKKLAEAMGMDSENIFLGENGMVFEFDKNNAKVAGQVPAGNILVDGLGVGDVGSVVLKDRKHLSDDGMIAIVVSVDKKTRKVVAGPEIVSRGFVYVKDNNDLMNGIKNISLKIMADAQTKGISDWNFLKSQMREQVKGYVFTEIKRDPMILPIIMDVDVQGITK